MQLSDIMTTPVETVTADASLADAATLMLTLGVGVLPVTENQKIVGVVSDRDIVIRAVAKGLPPATKVEEIMTREVFSCPIGSEVKDACDLMEEKQVRRLLITDAAHAPIGIVSLGDIALHVRREQSGEVLQSVSKPD